MIPSLSAARLQDISPACLLTRRKGSKFSEKSPITSSIKLLKVPFLLGRRTLEHLEGQPIWSETKFFIFLKLFMLTSKQHLWVLSQREFAQQQKIAMFKIGKRNIRKFGFPSCRHMIFYY
jgi:hypothetical protein